VDSGVAGRCGIFRREGICRRGCAGRRFLSSRRARGAHPGRTGRRQSRSHLGRRVCRPHRLSCALRIRPRREMAHRRKAGRRLAPHLPLGL